MTARTRRLTILLAVFALAGCGSDGAGIDSTREKLDGQSTSPNGTRAVGT